MTVPVATLRAHLAGLLSTLDEEIRLLELRQSHLERLSVAVIERDETGMEGLLGDMQQVLQSQLEVDRRLRQAQSALAGDLGCPPEQVRLQLLAERFQGRHRANIESRRKRIVDLAEGLRRKHLRTSVLLRQCARINRLLLEAIFPQSKEVATYSTEGHERWRPDTGLVSAER